MSSERRILMVEDDPEQAMLFGHVLKTSGYQVDRVATAEEAETSLDATPYDLLLADWALPKMQGDELIRLVKVQHPGLKTLLFSNHADVDKAAAEVGADAWLRKIEGVHQLRETIRELLSSDAHHD